MSRPSDTGWVRLKLMNNNDDLTYSTLKNAHTDETELSIDIKADEQKPVHIQPELLALDILNSILEEYIHREGTNYGDVEYTLETKVKQLHAQIVKGDVVIVFDPESESVTLMTHNEFQKLTKM